MAGFTLVAYEGINCFFIGLGLFNNRNDFDAVNQASAGQGMLMAMVA